MATPSGALEADLGAVTFHLPGAPLAATSELLLAAAREVQRAGGALAPQQARHALAESLLVRSTHTQAARDSMTHLAEVYACEDVECGHARHAGVHRLLTPR